MSKSNAKPCPWCGRLPRIYPHMHKWLVRCNCGGPFATACIRGRVKSVAVRRWNKRRELPKADLVALARAAREELAAYTPILRDEGALRKTTNALLAAILGDE